MDTKEKIENGTIRIENGRLTGLGNQSNESIDIEFLNTLLECSENGIKSIAQTLDQTIVGIGRIGLYLQNSKYDVSGMLKAECCPLKVSCGRWVKHPEFLNHNHKSRSVFG